MSGAVPYGVTEDQQGLQEFAVEVSWGSQWVNLNDHEKFVVDAEATRDSTAKTWRKTLAQSAVLGGNYLIHAVPEMVTESLSLYVHGQDQTEVNDNLFMIESIFEQYSYRLRWTTNEYREYWNCQLADSSTSRGQVWTHNNMAKVSFSIPRYAQVTRERIA